MSNFKGGSPLDHTLVEVKHIREMINKFCPNMKLTQYNWALGKDYVTYGFYTFVNMYPKKILSNPN